MSLGGGMPRIPGGGRTPRPPRMPRTPRMRDPRTAARSQVSRNPLVRGWRRLRSNRLLRMLLPKGGAAKGGAAKGGAATGGSQGGSPGAGDAGAAAHAPDAAAPPAAEASATSRGATVTDRPPLTGSTPAPEVGPPDAAAAPTVRQPLPHHRPGPDATRKERRAARRAARRRTPRESRSARRARRAREGALWRSLLEVGRAQWGADFDERGLDPRFITAFDRQQQVLVTIPREEGGERRIVGRVEVEGFAPEGDAIVSIDPSEGRLPVRPTFRIRSATLAEPVPVTDDMWLEGAETPSGRFVLHGDTTVADLLGDDGAATGVSAGVLGEHEA